MSPIAVPRARLLEPRLPDDAAVKLIGLGGVGHIVARYAALFLASLGSEVRFVLIDGDRFEPSNASRMFFGSGGNKAAVLRADLLPRFAETSLSIIAIEEFLTPDNAGRLIQEDDLVLLTVDNHATRKLANDRCAQLRSVCLISGGNDGVGKDGSGLARRGTFGNVQIYLRRSGQDATLPLTRHHPEIQSPADRLPTDRSCTELIASVPQILFTNLAAASAILNALWLHLCGALHYGEISFDIADGLMRPMTPARPPSLGNPTCHRT
ncbi:MAG TPA: ThiF family adenylyltransferase [Candidatus Paceibacterota bacterium]|nr:ThiF family adenylyltransferase [Verrucomicrobiota bacterium]HRZ47329.1 ThiF family adenylyltransferase [Candidatus Paceibacterota bacterium]HRZ94528.1 ThiF family adenylyltransferase [Candidatus Paceibacterota bacterium]